MRLAAALVGHLHLSQTSSRKGKLFARKRADLAMSQPGPFGMCGLEKNKPNECLDGTLQRLSGLLLEVF